MNTLHGMTFSQQPGLAGHDVVVVDVEGNGQQPPEIVEIAVLRLISGRDVAPADLRTWLIRPVAPITALVTRKVHGITNDDVTDVPRWAEVADDVTAALGDRVVVAHNAAVQRAVLTDHLPRWHPPLLLDTLRLAKAIWPDLAGGYGLDHLITHAGLTPPDITTGGVDERIRAGMGRHRAGYDTWMTAALLITLVRAGELAWEHLVTAARLPDPRPPRPTPQATSSSTSTSAAEQEGGLW